MDAQRADAELNQAIIEAITVAGGRVHVGTCASFDAFYRDMIALDAASEERVSAIRTKLLRWKVLAVDMEITALVNASHVLGRRLSSLCIGIWTP